jgi:hypothetical protein
VLAGVDRTSLLERSIGTRLPGDSMLKQIRNYSAHDKQAEQTASQRLFSQSAEIYKILYRLERESGPIEDYHTIELQCGHRI